VVNLVAEEGIRLLASSLSAIKASPHNIEARTEAQLGAWYCGLCLGSAAMALHHKICHVLGGAFNLPHAETHSVMLPYTAAYNASSAPEAMRGVARALGAVDAIMGLHELKQRLIGRLSLADLGMPKDGIEKAAKAASANPYPNPRPIEYAAIRAMIEAAYRGSEP
jgi:maleylacetate reductase